MNGLMRLKAAPIHMLKTTTLMLTGMMAAVPTQIMEIIHSALMGKMIMWI